MRKVIVNSTPLITLSKLRHLPLLRELYEEIIIPYAVKEEITVKNDLSSQDVLDNLSWIKVTACPIVDRKVFSSKLHSGEVEVLILAQNLQADLIIVDDKPARKAATFLGFEITGTIGVLVKAKKRGLIKAVKPFIESMKEINIRLSDDVINMALSAAGEILQTEQS